MLVGIDHVGIACFDVDAAIRRYETLFRLELAAYEERPESGVLEAMLRAGPRRAAPWKDTSASYVQLLQPTRDDTALARFLKERGEGIQHIGYAVADLEDALRHLGLRGVRVVPDMPRHGIFANSIAFLEASALGGVLTELVEVGGP
ncbi:MAG: VOC family protein [Acidimicrobiales bacterium]